jgi:hypothetical protein
MGLGFPQYVRCSRRGGGCREHGEGGRKGRRKSFQSLFNFLIFLIDQGHFRNFNIQNDVVLCFPSILTA